MRTKPIIRGALVPILVLLLFSNFSANGFPSDRVRVLPPSPLVSPSRVGTYWLNFSLVDSSKVPFANIGFQFYVATNQTDLWQGFASTPIEIAQHDVNFIQFSNVSALFESYVYSNGSQYDANISFTGPPYYGPPSHNYARVGGSCGFPCIATGVYLEQNTSGISGSDKAWSFWFEASNLIIVPTSNQLANQTLRNLDIVVNMSVSMIGCNASNWSFQPNVQIAGAKYFASKTSDSSTFVIQTGVGFSPSPWNALTVSLVGIVVIGVGVASFLAFRKYRGKDG